MRIPPDKLGSWIKDALDKRLGLGRINLTTVPQIISDAWDRTHRRTPADLVAIGEFSLKKGYELGNREDAAQEDIWTSLDLLTAAAIIEVQLMVYALTGRVPSWEKTGLPPAMNWTPKMLASWLASHEKAAPILRAMHKLLVEEGKSYSSQNACFVDVAEEMGRHHREAKNIENSLRSYFPGSTTWITTSAGGGDWQASEAAWRDFLTEWKSAQ